MALTIVVAGCVSVALMPQFISGQGPFVVSDHEGGRESRSFFVPAESEFEREILDWLDEYQGGWHRSMTTYAPATMIRGSDFSLNVFSNGFCVWNGRQQLTKQLDPTAVHALRERIRIAVMRSGS
jgi:hypothetical protein